jgi:hypothetical protein
MRSSSNIQEVPPEKNTGFSHCHLRGTFHITCWDTGLSKFRTLVCLIQWSSQPNTFVSWTFLIGEPLTQLPSADYTNVTCKILSRWQTYQQQFWQWWSSHCLRGPQQLQHWQRNTPNLQPGDLVLLRENYTTPLHWPTAVITDIHPRAMASSVWSHLGTPREF